MGLRGLTVVALIWIAGVAMLATRIGGSLGAMIALVFILPVIYSSIDAAWQASSLMPSAYQKQRRTVRAAAEAPDDDSADDDDDDAAAATAEPVIPEPAPPASLDPQADPVVGQPLQL